MSSLSTSGSTVVVGATTSSSPDSEPEELPLLSSPLSWLSPEPEEPLWSSKPSSDPEPLWSSPSSSLPLRGLPGPELSIEVAPEPDPPWPL